jgi:hypothetical protein
MRSSASRGAPTSASPGTSLQARTASAAASPAARVRSVRPGATLAVENPTAAAAVSWLTTSHGLRATPADGTDIVPSWAD